MEVPPIKKTNWITTNELHEAIMALKMVKVFLALVEDDIYHWKWVLVILHNSLQGYMVCALRGKDGLNILKDSAVKKWQASGKKGSPQMEEMDTFLNLYKKIKGNRMLVNSKSKVFTPRDHQDRSIRKLNQLRNNFLHFKAKSWHLEINGLPGIAKDTVDIIRFLVYSSGNIKAREEQSREIKEDINSILNQLEKLMAIYSK